MALKVGIAGAGGMASYHIKGFREEGAEIAAVADPGSAAAERLCGEENIDACFSSLGEMLEKMPDIDAVSVITPNRFHKPLAVEALQKGKHVFCEKPPALNGAEAVLMREAAEKSGKLYPGKA